MASPLWLRRILTAALAQPWQTETQNQAQCCKYKDLIIGKQMFMMTICVNRCSNNSRFWHHGCDRRSVLHSCAVFLTVFIAGMFIGTFFLPLAFSRCRQQTCGFLFIACEEFLGFFTAELDKQDVLQEIALLREGETRCRTISRRERQMWDYFL